MDRRTVTPMDSAPTATRPDASQTLADLAPDAAGLRPWAADLRRAGRDRFAQTGLPARRAEAWRHTNLRALRETQFVPAQPDADAAGALAREYTLGDAAAAELVFVNGAFSVELSRAGDLPDGLTVGRLGALLRDDADALHHKLGGLADAAVNPFVALNQAHLDDGAFVQVDHGAKIDRPVHLLFVSTPGGDAATASHPRTLALVGDGAAATIVESYAGPADSAYLTNAVTEISVGEKAEVDHVKLNQESHAAFHVATAEVTLAAGANFASHSGTLGGRLTRNDLNVTLAGEQAHATLNGLVVGQGNYHTDNHTLLRHHEPNCTSYELYKHVMDAESTGVFKGQIYVAQKAQKTDAVQNSRSLLLSDDAQMNSQPALEIYADDVKCTHGSTTGPLDEGGLFYLNTRGVDAETARRLLTYAFAADVTRRIKVEPVRARIEDFLAKQHGLPTDFRIQDLAEATEDVVF